MGDDSVVVVVVVVFFFAFYIYIYIYFSLGVVMAVFLSIEEMDSVLSL